MMMVQAFLMKDLKASAPRVISNLSWGSVEGASIVNAYVESTEWPGLRREGRRYIVRSCGGRTNGNRRPA